MRTIIAGSRDITDYEFVKSSILEIMEDFTISAVLSGCCRGVDRMGERFAEEHLIPVVKHPARWDLHGKSAGMLRNIYMAQDAEAAICFWDGKSRGTGHMIKTARALGLTLYVVKVP